MTTHKFQKRGVVIRSASGKYWRDYSRESEPWVDTISRATIHDPKYCTHPECVTYPDSPDRKELIASKLLPVTVTTIYEVEEP